MAWGDQHDRLLTFVYRVFDTCVRDAAQASALTVDLFGRLHHLVDRPDLDDETTRAEVVVSIAAALRERTSREAIQRAIGHAAWQDRLSAPRRAGAAGWHTALGAVTAFTRHLQVS
ncbi:hypothetical protein BJP25_27040 [Actinokineospora bangkokensis]|uniref:Uncharacterized protein n=1 Tax=Actinokineospora bangkokensis TaxID=1193682 RepID=A0A1Q9LH40_9PSEU|nr:hypothetical protein BJP25_27040 [Actinokineospora bangkokensis]